MISHGDCVDYRALRIVTIKSKFPLPLISFLTNCMRILFLEIEYLWSGYHQIRMHPSDIEKMIFRTHQGPYELFVMPFSNAPSTFKALLKEVPKTY